MKLFRGFRNRQRERGRPDYNQYRFTAWEWLRYGATGFGIGALACWLCYHSVWALPAAPVVMVFYLKRKRRQLTEARKNLLLYHFKDFLGALHTALNSGYSVENGVRSALSDMRQLHGEKDVMVTELKIMAAGLRLHRPVEELFYDLGERSTLPDIRLFAELLGIAKRQGGSMGKVLSDTRRIIYEKIETRQEIDKILASKVYEQKIMSIMPAVMILYMRLTFDGFIEQMYGNALGVIIMTIGLLVYVAAWAMGKKIVRIEV